MPFFYTPHMTLLRLYLRQDTPESLAAASDRLDKLEHFLESTHNVRMLMEVFALKALYWQARGEKAAALETLACAIRLAEPGGYVRIFADLGGPLDGLLAELQQQGVAPLLIATIRAAIEPEASGESSSVSPVNDAPPVSDNLAVLLTFREQEVLQLMGEHLTNQEIAATLFISTETVKRHCISIFRKLQVKNRRAAAVYASQLSRS
jgi:LuxR family transcriptional regulator, maltose regulon positive regulatory protein